MVVWGRLRWPPSIIVQSNGSWRSEERQGRITVMALHNNVALASRQQGLRCQFSFSGGGNNIRKGTLFIGADGLERIGDLDRQLRLGTMHVARKVFQLKSQC